MSEAGRNRPPGPDRERLTPAQWVVVTIGVAGIGWGLWHLVVVAPSATRPPAALLWLAAGLVVHDAVLAPLAVLVAIALGRTLRAPVRRVVGVLVFVLVALVLVALPRWFGQG